MVQALPARNEVPVELTWELESIFASDQLWEERFAAIGQQLPELAAFQGTLGQDAAHLYETLERRDQIGLALEQLFVYANMRFHEDTTRTQYQALQDRAMSLIAEYAAATAFFVPEILALPPEQLEGFLSSEPRLALYRHQIEDITRARPHVRSAEVEQVLASMIEIAQAPERIFEMINNADLKLPVITNADGEQVQLSHGNYAPILQMAPREVRKVAFEGMYTTFRQQQNTIATNLATNVKKNLFLARVHHYNSALEASLDGNNIPVSVYTNLIATVNANLPVLHRYLKLRQRLLQLDEQHMYDVYAQLVPDVEVTVPFAEARERVIQAVGPLGSDYVSVLTKGLHARWVDVMETQNKMSGAYSSGIYGTHPFVLLNYQSRLDDVFTLAHEMGHSMHSYYTWQTQPYPYANYTLFLAEIASTLNEALLTHYLLETVTEKNLRAYIINHYLEGFRATLFRQTMFADFEMTIHQRAEAGEALTPELLCALYKDLNDRYFGAAGVVVDDLVAWEWARIPHFYYNFYVYQYATGISASAALAQAIIREGQPAVDRYLQMLRSGSSDYSIDLLRAAGVDMTTPAPVEAAIAEFDNAISEMEKLMS